MIFVLAFKNVIAFMPDGETLPGRTVLVEEDRISRAGPASEVEAPGCATVIDGAGLFLMPGLVDAHVHTPSRIDSK
ncbi:MAG: hypothetical protein IMW97_02100 [Firmicutes bacterium]|nr:hypothetical protein [Candidatus Fermentithermobacillaceae bacterium]